MSGNVRHPDGVNKLTCSLSASMSGSWFLSMQAVLPSLSQAFLLDDHGCLPYRAHPVDAAQTCMGHRRKLDITLRFGRSSNDLRHHLELSGYDFLRAPGCLSILICPEETTVMSLSRYSVPNSQYWHSSRQSSPLLGLYGNGSRPTGPTSVSSVVITNFLPPSVIESSPSRRIPLPYDPRIFPFDGRVRDRRWGSAAYRYSEHGRRRCSPGRDSCDSGYC